MSRIDSSTIATGRADVVAMTRERAGSLSGEQVRVKEKDAISVLEDAREEISMAHSEKVESKAFNQRRVGGAGTVRRMQIEQIQAYLDGTRRYPDPRELISLARRMQADGRPRDVAERASRSPSHQFALLQFALADAHRNGLPAEVTERLQEALEDLDHEFGAEVRAGLNTAQAAAEFGPTPAAFDDFQHAYTDIVLGEKTFAQTLLLVLQRLSGARGADFDRGLRALLGALGADLSAASASTDPVRLQSLVQDVYQLEVAGSVLESCNQLSRRIADRFGIETVEPLELMKDLVAFTSDRWVVPARMTSLAEKFHVAGLPERLAFHAGTRAVLRQMPVKVFNDAESRLDVLGTAQAVYDETAAAEEERLERQGNQEGNEERANP